MSTIIKKYKINIGLCHYTKYEDIINEPIKWFYQVIDVTNGDADFKYQGRTLSKEVAILQAQTCIDHLKAVDGALETHEISYSLTREKVDKNPTIGGIAGALKNIVRFPRDRQ